jgi:hypothetical protein
MNTKSLGREFRSPARISTEDLWSVMFRPVYSVLVLLAGWAHARVGRQSKLQLFTVQTAST